MSEPASDRSRHVAVDVSEARVTRLWGSVSARLESPHAGRRWLTAVVAAALVGAAGVAVFHLREPVAEAPAAAFEGARLESADKRVSVALVDGSELTLAPHSEVAVQERSAKAVKLVVEQGRVVCDVAHREGRSFLVLAGGVEVRVVGTRFSVAKELGAGGAPRVEVKVERGVVEVRAPGQAQVTRVAAGERWLQSPSVQANDPPNTAIPVEAPASSPTLPEASPAPSTSGATSPGTSTARRAGVPAPSAAESSAVPTARELFEQASGFWRVGRAQEAADAYQRLVSTYPRDGRAGLAAFELGRLRMDRLGDMRGALRALERALTLAPGSSFREDALARIVHASVALGNASRCSSAREQYLREYPNGVHRLRVTMACRAE